MSPMSRGGQFRLERLRLHIQQQQTHKAAATAALSSRSALKQRIREASRLDVNDIFFQAFGGAEELEALEFDLVRTEVPVRRHVDSRSSSRAASFSSMVQQQQRTITEPSTFCPANRYDALSTARPRPMLPAARSMSTATAIGVLTSNSSLSNHNASAIAAAATSRMSQLARPSSHMHSSPAKRNPLKRLRVEESMRDVENIAPVLQKSRFGHGPASMMDQTLGASSATNTVPSRLQLGSNFRLPTTVNTSRPFALRQAPW